MSSGVIIAIIIGLVLGFINEGQEKERQIWLHKEFYKYVAYHEAGHVVFALYNGFRCVEMVLNLDTNNKMVNIHVAANGHALIILGKFDKDMELIKMSTMINLNTDRLPQSEETINFAKRYLQVLYAGDIVMHIIFNIKFKNLLLNQNTKLVRGEDKHLIQNIHDYLEKVGQPVTVDEVVKDTIAIIENNKEIKAAIHFLADTMLKNPGIRIPESKILDDLKMSKFFDMYLK
jgi:hypothetical protein